MVFLCLLCFVLLLEFGRVRFGIYSRTPIDDGGGDDERDDDDEEEAVTTW